MEKARGRKGGGKQKSRVAPNLDGTVDQEKIWKRGTEKKKTLSKGWGGGGEGGGAGKRENLPNT